jgi:hypothetical protein
MRIVTILVALAVVGCVHQEAAQPKTITKPVYQDKIISPPQGKSASVYQPVPLGPIIEKVIVHVCRPEPADGCNSLKSEAHCRKHLRCDWTRRGVGYCHRIYCRDS